MCYNCVEVVLVLCLCPEYPDIVVLYSCAGAYLCRCIIAYVLSYICVYVRMYVREVFG